MGKKIKESLHNNKVKIIQRVKSKNNFWSVLLSSIIFIILLVGLFRLPYIGEFIDAVIFSFLFGWSKYIIYFYVLIVIILFWLKKLRKPLYSKRLIILLLITSFLVSCLLSSVEVFIIDRDGILRSQYITNYCQYWMNNIFPSDNNFNPFLEFDNHVYVDGGFFGILINYLSSVIVMIISIIGIFAIYLSLATKHREKILSLFNNKINKKENKTSSVSSVDTFNNEQPINSQTSIINDDSYLKTIEEDWKKNYLSLNAKVDNKINDYNQLVDNVIDFFKKNNLDFLKYQTNENSDKLLISFLVDDENYKNFKFLQPAFKIAIGGIDYSFEYENNELTLIFNKSIIFNNKVLEKNLTLQNKRAFDFAFLNANNVPIIMNLRNIDLFGIFDPKDKNSHNLINNLIYNLSWNYKTTQLKVFYLSIKNTNLPSFKVPNFSNVDVFTSKDTVIFLKKVNKDMNELLKDFKKRNVTDLYSYNSITNKNIANKVIILNDFNQMCVVNPEIIFLVNEIAKNALLCGISIFMIDKSIDGISYNNVKYNTALIFKSNIDLSKKVINGASGVNLKEFNHGILFNYNTNKSFEITLPQINSDDEKIILDSLKKCYEQKNF